MLFQLLRVSREPSVVDNGHRERSRLSLDISSVHAARALREILIKRLINSRVQPRSCVRARECGRLSELKSETRNTKRHTRDLMKRYQTRIVQIHLCRYLHIFVSNSPFTLGETAIFGKVAATLLSLSNSIIT